MAPPFAEAVIAARAAQRDWFPLGIRQRLCFVRNLRDLLVTRADDLIEAVGRDVGRPAVEVLATELLPAAAALKFLESTATQTLRPRTVAGRLTPTWLLGCRDVIHRRPWGIVGVMGTWNYPLHLNIGPICQALIAGNAVLWKPSEHAARSAEVLHQLMIESGFPSNLIQRLPATREAGPQLAEASIDYLLFTGSDSVGRKLAARLGERLIPSTLELSGCDAMLVLADADIELAARAALFGLTLNRGQTCIAVRRILVHQTRYSAFEEAIRKIAARAQPVTLLTAAQLEQAHRLIDDARRQGARVVECSGSVAGGTNCSPTLLFDIPAASAICNESCFAPLAAVMPFETNEQALALHSASSFGLSGSIFTSDVGQGLSLAERLGTGSVVINDVLVPTAHPATPFGGRGTSGWGVTQGREGLLAMTVPQVVTVRRGRFRPHYDEAIAPDPATGIILRGLLRWSHARGLRAKLLSLRELWRGVRAKKKAN